MSHYTRHVKYLFTYLLTCCVLLLAMWSSLMESQRDPNSMSMNFDGRFLQAIESLEKRVSSEISASERQSIRVSKVLSVSAVAVVPSFVKPGRADQYKFCEEVKGIATTALAPFRFDEDVQRWVPDVDDVEALDSAVEALQRVSAASETRQKLIKMADRSELGWRVVQHYVADPVKR